MHTYAQRARHERHDEKDTTLVPSRIPITYLSPQPCPVVHPKTYRLNKYYR